MAASAATSGFGAVFAYESAADTYTALGEVLSITPPPKSRDTIEATHMLSDDGYREFIGGLRDGGESSLALNYTEAGSTLLETLFAADVETFRITLAGASTVIFNGIITAFSLDEVVIDDKMAMSLTIKVTGKPTFLAV